MLKTINTIPKIDIKSRDLEKARAAISWLASCCDFASTNDGKGFSGPDAVLGHALAEKKVWSPGEARTAFNLVVKYKKQLTSARIDTTGLDVVRADLNRQVGGTRVRVRDMVDGDIRIVGDAIIIKSDYNPSLVSELRELVGRKWDPKLHQNTCTLCSENAADVQDIAVRYGLKLHRSKLWKQLVSARRVEQTETEIRISGVNARQVVLSLPEKMGQPAVDEKSFSAINILNPTCIAIPLTSWVIRQATLWLHSLDEHSPNFERIQWAIDEVLAIMGAAYPKAMLVERANYSFAFATTLPQVSQEKIASTLPPETAKRLMHHQWVAIHSLLNKPQAILADQQGLGKTIEILSALESANAYPAVVCAPATAVLNWRDEANRWLPHRRVCALGGKVGKREQGSPLEKADLIILNYEAFSKHAGDLEARNPLSLVADEAQYLKGHDSIRTKAIRDFCRSAGVQRIIAATGTPVMNRPSEFLTLLTLLPDMLAELGGFQYFAARYCQATLHKSSWASWWDYSGAANLGELANRIRETGRFVRREKASVLPDLAAKRYAFEAVTLSNQVEYAQVTQDYSGWLKTQINHYAPPKKWQESDDDGIDTRSEIELFARSVGFTEEEIAHFQFDRSEAIRRMTALRRLTGRGKIPAAVEMIKEIVKEEKLVVFAAHIEVQEALVVALTSNEGPPLSITGDMSAKARHEAIACFQGDPKAKVIICSLKAAQTAITLTAAARVLMVEMDWTPSTLEQAEDRVHRIGQSKQVTVTYLHAVNTIDDRMAEIIKDKQSKIGIVVATNGAIYGFKKDGTPRKRPAGPGRHRLNQETRVQRRKNSKAAWQAKNPAYMREYMQVRRLSAKIDQAKRVIREYDKIKNMSISTMKYTMGYQSLSQMEYTSLVEDSRKSAELATANLTKLRAKLRELNAEVLDAADAADAAAAAKVKAIEEHNRMYFDRVEQILRQQKPDDSSSGKNT